MMSAGGTGDARAGVSRRDFLRTSGVLVVGFSAFGAGAVACAKAPTAAAAGVDDGAVDSWLAVADDGLVTVFTGKCELGQGILTAQTQLVAEELGVPVARVSVVMCDTDRCPDQGTTSGSQSHPTNFNHANLALAAATAREALLRLGAERLGVPDARLVATDGAVWAREEPTSRVEYAALIGGRRFDFRLDPRAARRPKREWTVLGSSVPRVDMRALVTATEEFVQTVRVPGMLHGAVVRPPGMRATLEAVDEASVAGMPGLVKVVTRGNFVGVVAEKPWQAVRAARQLQVRWKPGEPLPSQATFFDYLRNTPARDAVVVDSGDVDEKLASAANVVEATYFHPYQVHGSVGSSCAVADVRTDGATIWSASQSCFALAHAAAGLLDLPDGAVRVIFVRGSGCYGLNGADTVSYDAAILSQAAGRPVRVQLSRRDEMAWENFGYAYVVRQRAGLTADGRIAAWDYEAWYPSLGGRPGTSRPGDVATGMLAGFEPSGVSPSAARPPSRFSNNSNAAPSYVAGAVGGRAAGTGRVAAERVVTHTVPSPFFTGPLRSPSRLQNTFAHESFMDELAAKAGADPVAFRLAHLRDPRLAEVLRRTAERAGWQARPSPAPGSGANAGVARGRGVACVFYEGHNGYCALAAEVEVTRETGEIRVTRFVSAQDCGPISTPDGMRNQIEGGALQGLSRALGEAVTWDDHAVTSVDWRTYRTLTLGTPMPAIESVLVDQPDGDVMGAGETTITLVAGAVGNAVFDATGARLREVPFTPARVKAALAGRDR